MLLTRTNTSASLGMELAEALLLDEHITSVCIEKFEIH